MRESLSYICSEKDCEAVGSSFMAELLLILSFLFNLFLTILLHVFILNLVNWSGELVRQAERKFRTSTRIPDLDNANVGTNAKELRSREKPMASPVFSCNHSNRQFTFYKYIQGTIEIEPALWVHEGVHHHGYISLWTSFFAELTLIVQKGGLHSWFRSQSTILK